MSRVRRLNQASVVAAAAELANRAGSPEALTLAGLARALQVRVPSLYNHVAGMDGLRRELRLYGLRALLQRLRDASFGLAGQRALWAMSQAYREFARQMPGLYPLTLAAPDPGDPELEELARELVGHLLLTLAAVGLRGDDALHAVRGLRALLHGFASLETAGAFGLPLDRDESFARLLEGFLDSLGPGRPRDNPRKPETNPG